MSRLWRPTIPVKVKCQVALRQLGEKWSTDVIEGCKGRYGFLLSSILSERLAPSLGCKVSDLRLDHDPPLGARPQFRRGLGKKTYYEPDANDPNYLFYRPHGPEFEGSHLIKTNVRGDHGQHPDRVLIKRAKRLAKPPKKHRVQKIRSRGFDKTRTKKFDGTVVRRSKHK